MRSPGSVRSGSSSSTGLVRRKAASGDWRNVSTAPSVNDAGQPPAGTRESDDGPAFELMGVVNVTPDSFSDGGLFLEPELAIRHGLQLEREGAAIIDVGGESTRPGAEPVGAED